MRTEFVYVRPPADALTCLPEPPVPESLSGDDAQDADAAAYEAETRKAGADCRAKVDWIRAWAASLK